MESKMLNFTVGPVMSDANVLSIGAEQVPYFRTPEFSDVMLENERLIKEFAKAPDSSRVVFITGSGTASMEASIMNTLTAKDRVLVVNGGSFGARFVELLELYGIPYTQIKPEFGYSITAESLAQYDGAGYTAFVVNMHETSVGVLYDMLLISDFCKRNGLFLIVDAISAFLADPIDMQNLCADVIITGSQKALACPPGVSIIVLSECAIKRVNDSEARCLYLDLKAALKNGERGQTPYTCAVGTLLQINARLKQIAADGGVDTETKRIADIATDFRTRIKDLPFELVSHSMSNCVTSLHPTTALATKVFTILKDKYNIWVCPNGGEMKDKIFRVGHIGALTKADNDTLIKAFYDLQKRGII